MVGTGGVFVFVVGGGKKAFFKVTMGEKYGGERERSPMKSESESMGGKSRGERGREGERGLSLFEIQSEPTQCQEETRVSRGKRKRRKRVLKYFCFPIYFA